MTPILLPTSPTGRIAALGHSKCDWYFAAFDALLGGRRYDRLRILEIGCSRQSLSTWADAFPNAEVVGLDASPDGPTGTERLCEPFHDRVRAVVIGDQSNRKLLRGLGSFDVVDDDGGHRALEQRVSFEELFPAMRPGGWYLIEDLHVGYDDAYAPPSILDLIPELIDELHARWGGASESRIDEIRIWDSLLAVRRRRCPATSVGDRCMLGAGHDGGHEWYVPSFDEKLTVSGGFCPPADLARLSTGGNGRATP